MLVWDQPSYDASRPRFAPLSIKAQLLEKPLLSTTLQGSSGQIVRLTAVVVLAAAVWGFVVALALPLITISENFSFLGVLIHHKFHTHSLLSAIGELYGKGQILTALAFTFFSLLMPAAKFITLGAVQMGDGRVSYRGQRQLLKANALCGKWCILEVITLAVFLIYWNQKAPLRVHLELGYYYFLCSVLCSFAAPWITGLALSRTGTAKQAQATRQAGGIPPVWRNGFVYAVVLIIFLAPLWLLSTPVEAHVENRPGFTGGRELALCNKADRNLLNLRVTCGELVVRARLLPAGGKLRMHDKRWLSCFLRGDFRVWASGCTTASLP